MVEDRLTALEKQNRQMRLALALIAIAAALAITVGAAEREAVPKKLTAEELNIVDSEGTPVVIIKAGEKPLKDGGGGMLVVGGAGSSVLISGLDRRAKMRMTSPNSSLNASADESAAMTLKRDELSLVLNVGQDAQIIDLAAGKSDLQMMMTSGGPKIEMFDSHGKHRVRVGMQEGMAGVLIKDPSEKIRWSETSTKPLKKERK